MSSLTPSLTQLYRWLMQSPVGAVRHASDTGELGVLIPEWDRTRGPWNIQHHAHHYPLDDHILKVVEATQRSPIFATLTPYEQWLTALSALLHDIEKNTGPQRIYGWVPVDKIHPLKSALTGLRILSRLGMPIADALRCVTLIHHHQAFGQLFIRYGEEGHAPDEDLYRIARKLRSVRLTQCLLALSEGDIRSVQAENAYFTPGIEIKLHQYGQRVCELIEARWPNQPLIPDFSPVNGINLASPDTVPANTPLSSLHLCLWPITQWEQLAYLLTQELWGGAWALPMPTPEATWDSLWQPEVLAVVGLQCLPENQVAYGHDTVTPAHPTRLPMESFYQHWADQATLNDAMNVAEHTKRAVEQDIRQFNRDVSPELSPSTSSAPLMSWSSQRMIVGTRPIVQSLWLGTGPPEHMSAILDEALPVLGRVSTLSAYAYGRL